MSDDVAILSFAEKIELEARLIGGAVDDLHSNLLEISEGEQDILLDAEQVDVIDTTAIQVLLSAAKTCQLQNKKFQIQNMGNEFLHAMKVLGLGAVAEEWELGNG